MNITVRPVKSTDLPELGKIFVDAYRPENTGENWTYTAALAVVKYWHQRAPKDLQVVAQIDGRIIGALFVDVKPWWDGYRMIDGEFFVSTACQKQGAGSQMLQALLKVGKEKYKCTYFETVTFMPEECHPMTWYKKLGFKKDNHLIVIKAEISELKL